MFFRDVSSISLVLWSALASSPPTVGGATHPRHMFPGPAVARPLFVGSSVSSELSVRFARWRPGVPLAVRLVLCQPDEPGRRGADTSTVGQVLFHLGHHPMA
jgi:hypothetical protein